MNNAHGLHINWTHCRPGLCKQQRLLINVYNYLSLCIVYYFLLFLLILSLLSQNLIYRCFSKISFWGLRELSLICRSCSTATYHSRAKPNWL